MVLVAAAADSACLRRSEDDHPSRVLQDARRRQPVRRADVERQGEREERGGHHADAPLGTDEGARPQPPQPLPCGALLDPRRRHRAAAAAAADGDAVAQRVARVADAGEVVGQEEQPLLLLQLLRLELEQQRAQRLPRRLELLIAAALPPFARRPPLRRAKRRDARTPLIAARGEVDVDKLEPGVHVVHRADDVLLGDGRAREPEGVVAVARQHRVARAAAGREHVEPRARRREEAREAVLRRLGQPRRRMARRDVVRARRLRLEHRREVVAALDVAALLAARAARRWGVRRVWHCVCASAQPPTAGRFGRRRGSGR